MIILRLITILACAWGNRLWGDDTHPKWFAVIVMTLGVLISAPSFWFPLYVLCIWFWRSPSPRRWFHVSQGTGKWSESFTRGLFVLPLGIVLTLVTHSPVHLLAAMACVFLVPVVYWAALKYKQSGPLAEWLAGALVGCV